MEEHNKISKNEEKDELISKNEFVDNKKICKDEKEANENNQNVDAKENVYPRKEKPQNKIDGMVALIMCINQAIWLDVEHTYSSATQTV